MTDQLLAAAGSAFVTVDDGGDRWSIGSAAIRKTVQWRAGEGLRLLALAHTATGHLWEPDVSGDVWAGGEFSLCWNGETLSARQATALAGVQARVEGETVTLQIDLRLRDLLDVSLCYRAHSAAAVIEQWVEVTALAGGVVSRVAPLTVSIADLPSPTAHWVRGLQGHGWHMPPSGPYPAYQLRHEPLSRGRGVTLESGLRSTWHEIAWLALDSGEHGHVGKQTAQRETRPHTRSPAHPLTNEGLFAGLLYSGRWAAGAQAAAGGAALAIYSDGYAAPLAAGQRWQGPGGFLGVYCGDLDAAARVQHAYLRAMVLPPLPPDFPWVQYNTWFAHLVDIDENILRGEAERAARLGCEVFVIDAGWWEPSLRTSDNFTTGLGVWQPSAAKFPSGLRAFADYVRSLGMRFGIWVEPERVDLRQRVTWRIDWLARHHDAIISPPWPPDTVSGWLCFGHPDVQAWAVDWISRLVADLSAEWLKWDSNWWGVCTCTDHGHSATDGEFHQVEGVHKVLAELRRRFPHLVIENCAGGGTRTDFRMLSNSHVTWLHDASTPSRRVRFHMAGANTLFPPEVGNSFVIDAEDESLADPNTPPAELNTIARSRMLGAFGVSARLGEWTEEALAAVQTAIAQYKQLRPLIRQGRFYHLLPQPVYDCPDLLPHGQWEAYALVDAEAQHGALWAFRAPDGERSRTIPLAGLAAETVYRLTDLDTQQTVTATGASLMQQGTTVDLTRRTSALLWIEAVVR